MLPLLLHTHTDAVLGRAYHERKIDDEEQYSRKINLLIKGIEVEIKETPATILKKIQVGISSANLVVPEYEFDRCHRIGKKYTKNGKTYQSVLLKLALWRTRNFLYQNRKLLPFKIYADLTRRRKSLLDFAKFKIENGQNLESGDHCEAISRSLNFVFCDLNCRLKVKSKNNRFYSFKSEEEFYGIILKIDADLTFSKEMIEDEANNSTYY